jgi:hypothetical protein
MYHYFVGHLILPYSYKSMSHFQVKHVTLDIEYQDQN